MRFSEDYTMQFFDYYMWVGIKLVIGLFAVLLFFQFSGAKRQFSQMTAMDVVSNFILCGLIGGYIYNRDITFGGFAIIMLMYFLVMYIINTFIIKTKWGRKLILGNPVVIINDGKINISKVRGQKMSMADLMFLLRSKGIHDLKDVKLAQVEVNGELTIVKKDEEDYALLLVDDGVINDEALKMINKDEEWLQKQLKKKNIEDMDDVFCAQWNDGKLDIAQTEDEEATIEMNKSGAKAAGKPQACKIKSKSIKEGPSCSLGKKSSS